jgi:nitrogen-specific signal transduction histidine kinase/CheY-like chemotaxis protein
MSAVKEGTRITGTQSALRDTTERKRLEAQYLQAQKMESVGRLAGGVAHDFNNLLTVINGYSELLGSKLGNDDEERTMLRQIHRAGLRAAELTAQLLTFSRKEAVQRKSIGLNAVVEEAGRMLQRVVGEDVEVVLHLGDALGAVLADSGQMHQVLMNLVVNARDSMPHGGKLTVETRNVNTDDVFAHQHPELRPGAYVCLAVIDTGTGMSEEVRRHIFEPFFTTKEPGKGTGLGLATVYGIVRQCGGSIVVESEPGAGTTFEIYLPHVQASAAEVRGELAAVPSTRGWETILLVEDQAAVRQLTEDMLRAQGYRVLPASGAAQAISHASDHDGPIHLLITDVILPHMNGRALADSLRADRQEMKVLYISGYSGDVIGVLEGGTYLAKPYSAEALAAKVREVLGTSSAGAGRAT